MQIKIDTSKEYGLILEGGGARGAYQIGVWKALKEHGIRIKGIAGASVGALNAAIICQGDLERAEHLWSEISYEKVISNYEDTLKTLMEHREMLLNPNEQLRIKGSEIKKLISDIRQIFNDGGLDIENLRKLIKENINPEKIRNSDIELYALTFSVDLRRELVVDLKALEDDEIWDMLMASAYFPAFKQQKLQGGSFMDGGMFNNVPLDVLLDRDYKDIIVIRIHGMGYEKKPFPWSFKHSNIYKIETEDDLGGMLEFDSEKAKHNLKLGYYDGLRFIYGLSGKKYYFDCDDTEKICYNIEIMERLAEKLDIERFRIYKPLDFVKIIRSRNKKYAELTGKNIVLSFKDNKNIFTRIADSFSDKE